MGTSNNNVGGYDSIETSTGMIRVRVPEGGFTGAKSAYLAAIAESHFGHSRDSRAKRLDVGDWIFWGGSLYWIGPVEMKLSESPVPRLGVESLGYIPVSSMEAALAS